MRRIPSAIVALAVCITLAHASLAAEIRLGIASSVRADPFVKSLVASPALSHSNLEIVPIPFPDDEAALRATLDGDVDLGLVSLDTLDHAKFEHRLVLAPIMTQPFEFKSARELFEIEDSIFGSEQ